MPKKKTTKKTEDETETKKSAAKEAKDGKDTTIDQLVQDLQGRFGEGAIMTLGQAKLVDVDVISTGSFSLDRALGVGGLPQGRIVEIYGPESSGKTTLALNVVAQAQAKGKKCAFIDAEHALDPEYAKKLGVKINELLISQPDNGEEALDILESLVRSGAVGVVVVDSVAALTPQAEIAGEMGNQFMGLQARMMSKALRKVTAITARYNVLVIFINQIRMKIGVMFGNPETTPGGRALKFSASVRIDIRRMAQIKQGEEIIGGRIKAKVVKNKVAAPFKIAEFDVTYGNGINYEGDVLTCALKYDVVKKSGATYSFGDEKIAVGVAKASERLKEDKKLLHAIEKAVKDKIKSAA